jgi:hypothetical protein
MPLKLSGVKGEAQWLDIVKQSGANGPADLTLICILDDMIIGNQIRKGFLAISDEGRKMV